MKNVIGMVVFIKRINKKIKPFNKLNGFMAI